VNLDRRADPAELQADLLVFPFPQRQLRPEPVEFADQTALLARHIFEFGLQAGDFVLHPLQTGGLIRQHRISLGCLQLRRAGRQCNERQHGQQ